MNQQKQCCAECNFSYYDFKNKETGWSWYCFYNKEEIEVDEKNYCDNWKLAKE
ncbi:MAG: hypothetical protein RLY43_2045 [Bacteroidota bacterium]|jgi:hypothetical protein